MAITFTIWPAALKELVGGLILFPASQIEIGSYLTCSISLWNLIKAASQEVNPACKIVNPVGQIVNPAGQIVSPASQIVISAGQKVDPDSQIVNPASQLVNPDG